MWRASHFRVDHKYVRVCTYRHTHTNDTCGHPDRMDWPNETIPNNAFAHARTYISGALVWRAIKVQVLSGSPQNWPPQRVVVSGIAINWVFHEQRAGIVFNSRP